MCQTTECLVRDVQPVLYIVLLLMSNYKRIITQGMEIIFRVGLAMLLSNQQQLLQLDMEGMLMVSSLFYRLVYYLIISFVSFTKCHSQMGFLHR